MIRPRIAIPVPTSTDPEYNVQGWKQYATAVEARLSKYRWANLLPQLPG
jgi:hypothetical protein